METLDEMLIPQENQAQTEAYIQIEEKPNMIEAEMISEPIKAEAEAIKGPEAMQAIEPPKPYDEVQKEDGMQPRKKRITFATVAIVILVLLGVGASIFIKQGELTGLVTITREVPAITDYNQVFDQNTEVPLDLVNITSLRVSGTLQGTRAIVKLRINELEFLVADISKPGTNMMTGMAIAEETAAYEITTDKAEYTLGEAVAIAITPEAANQSIYITLGEDTQKLDSNTYAPTLPGEYQAIALIVVEEGILRVSTNFTVMGTGDATTNETVNGTTNDTTPTETPSEALPPEPAADTYAFTDLCTDTCNLGETTTPILIVELEPGSKLILTQITYTRIKENSAPEQIMSMPDLTLSTGQTANLNLEEYFKDIDGDTVQYDINEMPEISAAITQSELAITSETPGVYTAYIYATDGDKLVTSNTFTITITQSESAVETNQTTNETTNESAIVEIADPCANPDINQRPSICFVGVENQAFEELNIDIQDNNRGTVGRFTRFGNLIIKGLLIQNTAGAPAEGDFALGFTERNGFEETRISSAWISTETGNLHIRGKIYENQEELNPGQFNTFVVRNKFGMILGYFDELTGDLHLRGNIVQLGRI